MSSCASQTAGEQWARSYAEEGNATSEHLPKEEGETNSQELRPGKAASRHVKLRHILKTPFVFVHTRYGHSCSAHSYVRTGQCRSWKSRLEVDSADSAQQGGDKQSVYVL